MQNGITAERLEFTGELPLENYFDIYNRIDIGLDPFPYNGGITTCDSLFMGVPVVSLSGQTSVGRAGRSLLSNVGLPELIAQTPEEYVQTAVKLAGDWPRLTDIRATLRERMQKSPLMDANRFARNVEEIYRNIWKNWCNAAVKTATKTDEQDISKNAQYRSDPEPITVKQALDLARDHLEADRLEEAARINQQVLQQEPDHARALHLAGRIAAKRGEFSTAVELIQKAIAANPTEPIFYNSLGLALTSEKKFDQAIAAFQTLLNFKPDDAQGHNNLGIALKATGDLPNAIEEYRRALQIKPNYAEAHNNLGNALYAMNELDQAIAEYRLAAKFKTDYAEAHNNLGNALKDQGRIQEAIHEYRLALRMNPKNNATHSNLILTLHYDSDATGATIHQEERRWNECHAVPLKKFIQPHIHDRDPERRLKIGYVSPDFRGHSVAFFMSGLLSAHDPAQVDVFCYADLKNSDETTKRLHGLAHHWRDITKRKDEQIAELIRTDQIDILVDLAGHTGENRLTMFARKPAPIQVTYLGYPGSTGMDVMDYRFTDAYADPPGENDTFYSEKLVRLPDTFLCYQPSATAPPVEPLPALIARGITFGCMNMFPKINAKLVELWARILKGLPDSRMLIKNSSLADAGVKEHVLELFAADGIGPERLKLLGWIESTTEHLALYNQMDIGLDTYPYNGTTTTCEALYMGVPVVTLAGPMHMSRVGVSILSNAGLPEIIAQTPEEYVQMAIKLADDLPKLAEIRGTLRERLQKSPLMDAKGLAKNVESAYRDMWHAAVKTAARTGEF